MDLKFLQLIVIPLVLGGLTLAVTWFYYSASISHQRTQRLREVVNDRSWRTVHPMVLILDVREAFGFRVDLDARALRLALDYQDKAFSALKDYLSSRGYVHVSDDGRSFQRSKKPGAVQSYGNWPIYVLLIALLVYSLVITPAIHLLHLGYFEAVWLLPIAALPIVSGIVVHKKMMAANRLLKLPPIADAEDGANV